MTLNPAGPVNAARKVVDAARKWARVRFKYRRMLRNRNARRQDVEAHRKGLAEATHAMETAIMELELSVQKLWGKAPTAKPADPATSSLVAETVPELQARQLQQLEKMEELDV